MQVGYIWQRNIADTADQASIHSYFPLDLVQGKAHLPCAMTQLDQQDETVTYWRLHLRHTHCCYSKGLLDLPVAAPINPYAAYSLMPLLMLFWAH